MPESSRAGPVVVTGGAGAIGSVLVREFLAQGREVRVIDSLVGGRRSHLPPEAPGRLSITAADVKEPAAYDRVFEGATEFWHLAANTDIRKGSLNARLDFDDGIVATYAVLETARRHGVRRGAYASSSVVYGYPSVFPTPESYGPLAPQSLYAAAKLAGEALFSAYAYTHGFRVHLFRFANIIGPHMTHGVLYDFFEKLRADPAHLEVLGDGRQAKSYLRTEDCVAAMLLATERAEEPVNIFNLGTRDRISVREIAEKVVRAHGGTARIDFTGGAQGWVGDVPQQLLAIDKIGALGWAPRYTSAQAIDLSIEELRRESPSAR